ncbi:hypothetical protein [Rubinisphaera italica]|uniref:Uncharacterized protein n=1 Tax=Rubinisphaera italica TaxID=2527969 RepID=A0A5C5XMS7_9PLAN|nr:hypothetical protein [Rubinisphaera italica]TWT63781.1 hypothetical protein Pan54_45400 [Rubinisphaera italica]
MKRTFTMIAVITAATWGGTNLWLAGFEQGYDAGEDAVWGRINNASRELDMQSNQQSSLPKSNLILVDYHEE